MTYEEWLAMEPPLDCDAEECDAEWDAPDDTGLKLGCLQMAVNMTSAALVKGHGIDKNPVDIAREFYEFVTE